MIDQQNLKSCFGSFATGVMIATTHFEGKNYGLTINSFASVSLDPALLLFSIDNKSSNLNAFLQSQHFALSILSESQLALAQEFAKAGNDSKWNLEKYFLAKHEAPIFENAIGYFECLQYDIVQAGDHHIIIGKIIDCKKTSNAKSLIYLNSKFV